jgi:hypothetical protein
MASLPEPEIGPLEEHLLICDHCRNRLESTDEYVEAMRAAATTIRRDELGAVILES